MTKCIEFNKMNKYFIFILLTAVFKYLNNIILGYNFNDSFEEINLYNSLNKSFNRENKDRNIYPLPHSRMIEFFFNYIGVFIFSLLLRIYELKITEKKAKYFFRFNDSFALHQRKISQVKKEQDTLDKKEIKENILYKFKNYIVNNSSFFVYVIISFIWVAQEIIMFVLFNYFKDVDFWFFEIVIVTLIYSKIFLVQIYRHQWFAIILNVIPSLLKIICIVLTFVDEEKVIYTEHYEWIIIGFLIHSTLTAIISFINCSIKSFLDLKYTTPSLILMFYSSMGIFVSFLICIISTFSQCDNGPNIVNDFSIDGILCKVNYPNTSEIFYFENFKYYFESYSEEDSPGMFIRTFIIIFDALTFFFYRYFFILSIKRTDPVHIYFYIPIYYVFQKVFLLLGNLINKHEFFNVGSEYKWAKYFLDISGDFFCLIGFLIYLEVIQINKWGLNTNLKKYISERCNLENISCFKNYEEDEDEDEIDASRDIEKENDTPIELKFK